jgi:hypothetical protein
MLDLLHCSAGEVDLACSLDQESIAGALIHNFGRAGLLIWSSSRPFVMQFAFTNPYNGWLCTGRVVFIEVVAVVASIGGAVVRFPSSYLTKGGAVMACGERISGVRCWFRAVLVSPTV